MKQTLLLGIIGSIISMPPFLLASDEDSYESHKTELYKNNKAQQKANYSRDKKSTKNHSKKPYKGQTIEENNIYDDSIYNLDINWFG